MEGQRVRLIYMYGEPQMEPGLEGIVICEDDAGQLHVRWQNGSHLALNPEVDRFEYISEEEKS